MIRLYLDEDACDHGLISALRAHGADVLSALEADMMERDDEEHLEFATAQGRVLYTFNVGDFRRIHAEYLSQGKSHAGLVIGRQDFSIGEQMRGLLYLIARRSTEEMASQAVFLSALLAARAVDEPGL